MILKILKLLVVLFCVINSFSLCHDEVGELEPSSYDIFLDLNYENLIFTGKVTIGITTFKNDTNKIKLYSRGLNITSIDVKLYDLVPLLVSKEIDEERERLIIKIPHLLPGKHSITVEYEGHINNKSSTGLFKQTCHSEKNISWIGGARLEPVYARSVFPSLELNEVITPVKITLKMKQGYKLVSSQSSIITTTNEGRQQVDLMFTHLHISKIGWLVYPSDGSIQTSTIGNQTFFTCRRHHEWLNEVETLSREMMKYTGHRMTNLQWALLPDSLTRISSSNNIVFIREHLVENSNFTSLNDYYENLMSMTEVISGQLLGNINNSKPWSELWLVKGLNKFLTYKLAGMSGKMNSEEYTAGNVLPRVLEREVVPHSFSKHFDSTEDVLSNYDQDLYDKAGLVLRMLEDVVGEENFKKALNKFINRVTSATNGYNYTQYFWESLISENEDKLPFLMKSITITDSGMTLNDSGGAFAQWVRSAGYPVISVSRHDKYIHISQQSVFKNAKGDNGYWWIPISVTSQTIKSPKKYWLRPRNKLKVAIPMNDTWYMINGNAKGLYRVNYDIENWRSLNIAISNNELDDIAKSKLIDDALGLAEQNILSYRIGLSFTRSLEAKFKTEMWEAISRHLITIRDILDSSPSYRNDWDEYVASFVKHLIFGTNSTLSNWTMGNDELNKFDSAKYYKLYLTKRLCRANPHCSSFLSQIQPALLKNNPSYGDSLDAISCHNVEANDNSTIWDNFFQSYLQYESASFERKIVRGFACTSNISTLTRFINMFFNNTQNMRLQDLGDVISEIAYSETAALKFIVNNPNIKLMSYVEEPLILSEIVALVSEKIYSEEGFAAVRRMVNRIERSRSYSSSINKHKINRAFERIKLNIWRRRQSINEISNWILGKDDPSLDYLSSATLPNILPLILFISPLTFILRYINSM